MQAIDVMTGLLEDGLLERNKNKMRLIDPDNQQVISIMSNDLQTQVYTV